MSIRMLHFEKKFPCLDIVKDGRLIEATQTNLKDYIVVYQLAVGDQIAVL